jgi:uncharacterized glyoxalase superfamily protein PhnB
MERRATVIRETFVPPPAQLYTNKLSVWLLRALHRGYREAGGVKLNSQGVEVAGMATQISPMLAVSDAAAAIEFYKRAFGAIERWRIGEPAAVAGMTVDGAEFFLAGHAPARGTRSPDGVGHTTVRIELFVDDPRATQGRAIAAGAREGSIVSEHTHALADGGTMRMLQGGVIDPFGHVWLIGKFLE